jgi:hypothetical protein
VTERDMIACTIKVPRASAGLVVAGQRIEVKFSHLPGLSSFTWVRVRFARPTPVDDAAKYYAIELELDERLGDHELDDALLADDAVPDPRDSLTDRETDVNVDPPMRGMDDDE